MSYIIGRVPKNYEGVKPTGREIKDLLQPLLDQVDERHRQQPTALLTAWPDMVGEKIAGMTKAVSIEKGVFLVLVQNSTLHSLLSTYEKPRLLKKIQETFPQLMIKTIRFRLGE